MIVCRDEKLINNIDGKCKLHFRCRFHQFVDSNADCVLFHISFMQTELNDAKRKKTARVKCKFAELKEEFAGLKKKTMTICLECQTSKNPNE